MFFGRGKNKIQSPYTLKHMYEVYKENVDEGSPYDISYSDYVKITTGYNKSIIDRLLDGFKIRLPYALGSLQIIKKKMYFQSQVNKRKGINWEATNKHGKVIHHLNEHSNNYKYLVYWDRRGNKVKGINGYKFVPCRNLKRTIAKYIKEYKQDYFEVS